MPCALLYLVAAFAVCCCCFRWHVFRAKGVEEVLQPASVCPQEDQWLLYTDTDIAIHATGFSVGEIMAGLRAKSKKGLPCLSAYKNGTFAPGPDLTARLGERNLTDTSWCHDHRDRLGRALAPGVDPRTPVAVAGFNDLKSERGPFYDDCVLLDSEGSPATSPSFRNGFSRVSQSSFATPHAPCDVSYLVLIGCLIGVCDPVVCPTHVS